MYLFTSESVSPGHPDKCADIIADTIVDRLLQLDPEARVATEVFICGRHITIGGEVKLSQTIGEEFYRLCALDALHSIGYPEKGFGEEETLYPETTDIRVLITPQSPDISQGVDQEGGEIGAGDQGMMFGFACRETPRYMPAPIEYARTLRDALYSYARDHDDRFGIDIKTEVCVDYGSREGFARGRIQKVAKVIAAIPHSSAVKTREARETAKEIMIGAMERAGIPFDTEATEFIINGTGRYVRHSPLADSGLSGRKVVCDTYGGYAPIGGGAQSSKDYTKVDRSGLYAARWVAKHIVAAGLASRAQVEVAYVIGRARPLHLTVDTVGTGLLPDELLSEKIMARFPLTPAWITRRFGLDRPEADRLLYADIAARGQVGYEEYPWEKLDALEWFGSLALSTK